MSIKEPELYPDDPQKKGNDAVAASNSTTTNQVSGILNIDKLSAIYQLQHVTAALDTAIEKLQQVR